MRLSILSALGMSVLSHAALAQDRSQTPVEQSPFYSSIGEGEASCEDPTLVFGTFAQYTGFMKCADGRYVRARPTFVFSFPQSGPGCTLPEDPEFGEHGCKEDSDCTDGRNGRCVTHTNTQVPYCGCEYSCFNDIDCRVGEICADGEVTGREYPTCIPANCRKNSHCASGVCEISKRHSYLDLDVVNLGCRSQSDTCTSDADCVGGDPECNRCELSMHTGHWSCSEACIAVGRPFLVDGAHTCAPTVDGNAWIGELSGSASVELSQAQREIATKHWLWCAQMEHASVAAFARFALQLMHLGAPPQLLSDTASAMQDEVRHAKDCFALAQRYSDQAKSAGALEVESALSDELDPRCIALDVFLEGCVGETVAAVEASMMSEHAQDPTARAVLARIAKDEHEHALLAWRSLRWMFETLPDAEKQEVIATLQGQVQSLRAELATPMAPVAAADQDLLAHGVPGAAQRRLARRDAIARVVLPCAEAMLGQVAASSDAAEAAVA